MKQHITVGFVCEELNGTFLKVKFPEGVRNVINCFLENITAHHCSVVYVDYIKSLEIYAKLKG